MFMCITFTDDYFIILFVNFITVYEEMFNTVKDNMSKRNETFLF